MHKWEYTSIRIADAVKLVDGLNELGQAGWELVSCVYTESFFVYYCLLKRPILPIDTRDENSQ